MENPFNAGIEEASKIRTVAQEMQVALIREAVPPQEEGDQAAVNEIAIDWINKNAEYFRIVFDHLVAEEDGFMEGWRSHPKETLKIVQEEIDKLRDQREAA